MKDNNKGFTLIELLVTLALIAALSVAFGLGANTVFDNSRRTDFAEEFKEIFKAANIYVEYSSATCNLDVSKTCNVTLNQLVAAGLLDKNYYNMDNPYKKTGKFTASDTIIISLTTSGSNAGKKVTKYSAAASCIELNSDNVEKFKNWGEC